MRNHRSPLIQLLFHYYRLVKEIIWSTAFRWPRSQIRNPNSSSRLNSQIVKSQIPSPRLSTAHSLPLRPHCQGTGDPDGPGQRASAASFRRSIVAIYSRMQNNLFPLGANVASCSIGRSATYPASGNCTCPRIASPRPTAKNRTEPLKTTPVPFFFPARRSVRGAVP